MPHFANEEHLRDLEFEADRKSERAFDVWMAWLVNYSASIIEESMDALIKSDPVHGARMAEILRKHWGLNDNESSKKDAQ